MVQFLFIKSEFIIRYDNLILKNKIMNKNISSLVWKSTIYSEIYKMVVGLLNY